MQTCKEMTGAGINTANFQGFQDNRWNAWVMNHSGIWRDSHIHVTSEQASCNLRHILTFQTGEGWIVSLHCSPDRWFLLFCCHAKHRIKGRKGRDWISDHKTYIRHLILGCSKWLPKVFSSFVLTVLTYSNASTMFDRWCLFLSFFIFFSSHDSDTSKPWFHLSNDYLFICW